MLQDLLDTFLLSAREQKVFHALLQRGTQPASSIARLTGLPRNTVRGILDKLVGLGLVMRSRRGNAHLYITESKERLVRTLKQRLDVTTAELRQQIQTVESLGEALTPPRRSLRRPKVSFYDGDEGLKHVYEDTLTSTTPLRAWASFDSNREALPAYFRSYYKRRAKRKIHMRSIHPATEFARTHTKQFNRRELRESVLVPEREFAITPEIQVYDNKVNIVSWRDKIGIIIESEEIASAMQSIFDLSYRTCKKLYGDKDI